MRNEIQRSLSVSVLRDDVVVRRSRSRSPSLNFINRAGTSPRPRSCNDPTAMTTTTTSSKTTGLQVPGFNDSNRSRRWSSAIMLSQVKAHCKSLHQVAREGDVSTMTIMLGCLKPKDIPYNINELNSQQFSPLHYAARHNHYDMVSLLINKGADVRIRGRDGLSPLHLLALHVKYSINTSNKDLYTAVDLNQPKSENFLRIPSPILRFLPRKTSGTRTNAEASSNRNVSRYLRRYAISRKNKSDSVINPKDTLGVHQHCTVENELVTSSPPPSYSSSTNSLEDPALGNIIALLVSHGAEVNSKDVHDYTPLHFAAMRCNVSVATELLQCTGINIEARDKENMTPLHLAAINNNEDIVQLLLDAGANARSRDGSHATPFLRAAQRGNLSIIRALLEYADERHGMYAVTQMLLDQNAYENTALHLAIENGHLDTVQHLVSKGADINAPRQKYDFPLHLAAATGNEAIVRILLENDDNRVDCLNANQETPLHRATEFNYVVIMDLLISHGADTERRDKRLFTPLLIAARSGHVEAIECLLKHGADPYAVDMNQKSIIYWSVECNKHDALMAMLKDSRSKDLLQRTDNRCNSPLHIAAGRGFLAITQSLVDLGCSLELKNEDEQTALHLAANNGKTKIVRSLLNSDAESRSEQLASEDEDGNTAIHLASFSGHVNVVKTLFEFGADLEIRNGRQLTPLDIAARSGHVDLVRYLLEAGTTLNVQDKTKTTALHLAAHSGAVEVVVFLLHSGADVSLRDDQGLNCLEVAIENNRRDVVRAIVQSNHWEEAMRSVRFTIDGLKVTPLRALIMRMPDIAEDVLARCTRTNQVYPEHPLYTVHFDYTLLDDAHITAEMSTPGPSPTSDNTDPQASYQSAQTNEKKCNALLDGHMIKENHPLMMMVRSGQQRLLTHAVCVSLLHLKWIRFGRYFYYVNLLFYVSFLALLTTYILSIQQPIMPYNSLFNTSVHVGPNNATTILLISVCDIWKANQLSPVETIHVDLVGQVGKTGIIILAVIHMFKELFVVYTMRLHYLGVDNVFGWGCYVTSIVVVTDFTECSQQTGYREVWQWQVGAACIFLAWINLGLFISKFPYLGIYVVMFTEVSRTFCKVCIVFFFFITAFAFSFHTVLYYAEYGPFTNAFKSIIAVTVMMLGEFNFETLFPDDPANGITLYPIVAYTTFVLTVLFVTIVSMNLLIGLAVSDIKEVKAKACLELMAMQVDLVLNLESMLPLMVRQRFAIRERSFTPNFCKSSWWQRMMDRLNDTGVLKERFRNYSDSVPFRCGQGDIDRIRGMQQSIVDITRSLSQSVELLRTDHDQLHKMVETIIKHQGIEWNDNDDSDASVD